MSALRCHQPPRADYSGALSNLSGAVGALYKSSNSDAATPEDCAYTGYVASQMASSTPAPEWQGTFETIRSNMTAISQLCEANPGDEDAAALAALTRKDVADILNDEEYLGQTTWGQAD
jgi:hypothetical protein